MFACIWFICICLMMYVCLFISTYIALYTYIYKFLFECVMNPNGEYMMFMIISISERKF